MGRPGPDQSVEKISDQGNPSERGAAALTSGGNTEIGHSPRGCLRARARLRIISRHGRSGYRPADAAPTDVAHIMH
jgi:hypothetical protein